MSGCPIDVRKTRYKTSSERKYSLYNKSMIISDLVNRAVLKSQLEKTITSNWVEEGVGPLDVRKSQTTDDATKKQEVDFKAFSF